MSSTTSPPPKITRSFSDFMRNASVEDKAELFGYVMDRVAERQQAVIDKARAMQAEKNAKNSASS